MSIKLKAKKTATKTTTPIQNPIVEKKVPRIISKSRTIYINDKAPTLKEAQKLVGGLIQFAYSDDKVQIICNEEGKLKGLPMNLRATKKWVECAGHDVHDFIAGPAIILEGSALMD